MARRFTRGTYDPITGTSTKVISAAAKQVRVDFQLDQLAQQHSAGSIGDEEYIRGLQNLTQEYRKGTPARMGLRGETIGAAQQVVAGYRQEQTNQQAEFLNQASVRFNQATTSYSDGTITYEQYKQERDLYNRALEGTTPIPSERKITQAVVGGQFWDQYQSGKMRNIMREKQIKGLYQHIQGQPIAQPQLQELAGSQGTLPYIKQQLQTEKGVPRNLALEQEALADLVKTLGRLPTTEEIQQHAYGTSLPT